MPEAMLDPLVRRLVKQTALWLLALAGMLFIPAGTLDWPGAWVLLAVSAVAGLASGLVLVRRAPDLVRERMRGPIQAGQKPWDKRLMRLVIGLCLAMPVVAGLDRRYGISQVPAWLQALGAAALLLGLYAFHVVLLANAYASTVVRVQSERGHQVISAAPYAWVRHPMYAGAVLYFLGIALLLGSWPAAGLAVALTLLFALRAVWEEETLPSFPAMPPMPGACAGGCFPASGKVRAQDAVATEFFADAATVHDTVARSPDARQCRRHACHGGNSAGTTRRVVWRRLEVPESDPVMPKRANIVVAAIAVCGIALGIGFSLVLQPLVSAPPLIDEGGPASGQ